MKAGWQFKPLGDLCKTGSGGTPLKSKKDFYENGTIPWLMSGEVSQGQVYKATKFITKKGLEGSSARIFPINTVLIAMYGATAGQVGILKIEASTNQAVCGVLPNDQFIPEFLYYFFLSKQDELISQATGNAQPNISQIKIKNTLVPIIDKSEQQRIVATLDKAFEQIAIARANTEKNLQNARTLFESHLQNVFEKPKDNWNKKRWGDLCDFVRGPFGGSLTKSIFKDEGYVVYEQKHAIHDHFNQLRYFIDEDKFNEMIRFEVKPGDIIMSCSGVTLGRVAVVPEGIKRGIINQALLKLTPKEGVSVHFIKHWLRSNIFQNIIFEYSGGAAIPNVPSAKILKDIVIPCPSFKEQLKTVSDIEAMSVEAKKLESLYRRKLHALDALKKSLLHQAFAGEL